MEHNTMHTRSWKALYAIAVLFLFVLTLAGAARAQSNTGTILGTVEDATGAVIPDAAITIRNLGTGEERHATANSSGEYTVPNLQVGHYSITASHAGFTSTEIADTELQVAQNAAINPVLKVGGVDQKINVIATQTALLNTVSASVGQVVDTDTVQNMPLDGRNFWQLTQLTPGVSYQQGGQNIAPGGVSIRASAVNVNVNGLSPSWTGWYLDGGNITEFQLGGTIISPNVDALQEFKVETGNMGADYGHSPTIINATLKSGTNQFHGTVFEFLRNNAADARNPLLPKVTPLHRNQFGFAVGGPIVPDRTFFFVDIQETLLNQQQVFNNTVPTDQERNGDFSDRYPTLGTLKDPITHVPLTYNGHNNAINPATISGPAQYFLNYLPHATNGSTTAAVANSLKQQLGQGDIRIDQRITAKDSFMARYSISDNHEKDPNAFPLMLGFPLRSRGQDLLMRETHTFSPKWMNEAQFSYYRSFFRFTSSFEGTDIDTAAGITGFAGLAPANTLGFPTLAITNYSTFNGQSGNSYPKQNKIRSWQYVDRMTYLTGHHNIRVGIENFHNTNTYISGTTSTGTFTFGGKFSGDNMMDFLLGYPQTIVRSYYRSLWGNRANFQSYYVQDDWRARRNLTVNAGFRWEVNPFYNGLAGQVTGYDSATNDLVLPSNFSINAQPGTPVFFPLFSDRFEYTNALGLPQSVRPTQTFNVAPRLGVAYSYDDNTVIRAGYGIFILFPDDNSINNTQNTVPFVAQQTQSNTSASNTSTFANPFNGQPLVAPNPSPGSPCSFGFAANSCSTPNVVSMPLHQKNTYIQEYNLAVQRQFGRHFSLDVAYVGNKTVHIVQGRNINTAPPSALASPPSVQSRRPVPQWGTINDATYGGNANYNSLQTKFEVRNYAGLTALVSYTYSKCLTDGTYNGTVREVNTSLKQYGPCNYDITHNFVTSVLYQLPFGRGRHFGTNMPKVADVFVGGWNISTIATLQSGLPYQLLISPDRAQSGAGSQRPNQSGPIAQPRTVACWYYDSANPNCPGGLTETLSSPALGTYGNVGVNTMRADGLVDFDMTLLKEFEITQRVRFELRGSFYNVFNHPTYAAPSGTIGGTGSGVVGATLNNARIGELAAKIYF
jgi:hypothetical protein